MQISIRSIRSKKRARDVGDITNLIQSIKNVGQLVPITVSKKSPTAKSGFTLICGARRLEALKQLGLTHIEAYIFQIKDDIHTDIAELEENLRRKDFTWQEETTAKCVLYYKMKKQDPTMCQETFSSLFHQSTGMTSMQLDLYDHMAIHPAIWFEDKITKAYELLRRSKVNALVAEKVKRQTTIRPNGSNTINPSSFENMQIIDDVDTGHIITTQIFDSAAELLENIPDHTVDLICTDPPFGINILTARKGHGGKQGVYDKEYTDSLQDYQKLLDSVVPEFVRVLKPGSVLYMFFGIGGYSSVVGTLADSGFTVNPVPLIWHRTGSGSAACQPKYLPASAYQAIIMAYVPGQRRILQQQGVSNVLTYNTIPSSQKTHPMEIPVDVYQDLMRRSVCPGDFVIDPFCGTGNSLIATRNLGCNVLGAEIKEEYRNIAQIKLQQGE